MRLLLAEAEEVGVDAFMPGMGGRGDLFRRPTIGDPDGLRPGLPIGLATLAIAIHDQSINISNFQL